MTVECWTIGRILRWTEDYFKKKGIVSCRLDAELLLADLLLCDRVRLYVDYDRPLTEQELSGYRERVRRRAAREPLAYITGKKEFFRLEFTVTPAVLIPRPETEILVEETIKTAERISAQTVLDIGTGSGAIIISLLCQNRKLKAAGADISPEALRVAQYNAERLGVADRISFIHSNWFSSIKPHKFDIIVSNPPYIRVNEQPQLQPELGYEPRLALYDRADGLHSYREILAGAYEYLNPAGELILECGAGQASAICALAKERYHTARIIKDYAGIERIVVLTIAGK